jgi:hypothetical protein
MQNFYGDRTVVSRIACAIHDRHSAATDFLLDSVAVAYKRGFRD